MVDEQMSKFLEGVVGVVEANRFEHHALWRFNDERERKLSWVENLSGLGETIGYINKRPVHVSLLTAVVDGHKLLFIDPTSTLVDHDMVRAWLAKTMPVTAFEDNDPRKRLNITDAMNFHNVFPAKGRE